MAKVIPLQRRGRLQAYRNVCGGIVAALLSYIAGRWLIQNDVLGNGYATTFFVAFVLTSMGLTVLRLWMVEPVPVSVRPPMKFVDRVKTFPQLLEDPGYRWFILAEACCVGARIGTPFYILYAGHQLALSGTVIGELSFALLGADTASNLLWGHLGDRTGYRSTFMLAATIWAAAIVLLLTVHHPWAIFAAFCGLGVGMSGYQMSQQTMVLEFGERADVAMRLALSTTIEGTISSIGPLIGGLIAWRYGYPIVMWTSFGFLSMAVILLIFRVREPRKRHAAPVLEGDLPNPESIA